MATEVARALADAGSAAAPNASVVVGVVAGHDAEGRALVAFPASDPGAPIAARTVVPLGADRVGAEVALLFEDGDPTRPIVMGVLRATREAIAAEVDGERVIITADREIVLRCGAASVTLTRAGKVLITGEYVSTRARGVNRIKGGSVQIN